MSGLPDWARNRAPYTADPTTDFTDVFRASCFCRSVQWEIRRGEVKSSMYCHCTVCQRLHGAPFQWAAVVPKPAVRVTRGLDLLHFYYSSEPEPEQREGHLTQQKDETRVAKDETKEAQDKTKDRNRYELPCKVSCGSCRSPIADEGRNMMLLMPTFVEFESDGRGQRQVDEEFKPTHHMFYESRVVDMHDGLVKYLTKKGEGRCDDEGNHIEGDGGD